MLDGSLSFAPSPQGTAGYDRYLSAFQAEELSQCTNDLFNVSDYPTIFNSSEPYEVGAFAYDCVVSFALAMSRAADPDDGDEVFNEFKQVGSSSVKIGTGLGLPLAQRDAVVAVAPGGRS